MAATRPASWLRINNTFASIPAGRIPAFSSSLRFVYLFCKQFQHFPPYLPAPLLSSMVFVYVCIILCISPCMLLVSWPCLCPFQFVQWFASKLIPIQFRAVSHPTISIFIGFLSRLHRSHHLPLRHTATAYTPLFPAEPFCRIGSFGILLLGTCVRKYNKIVNWFLFVYCCVYCYWYCYWLGVF